MCSTKQRKHLSLMGYAFTEIVQQQVKYKQKRTETHVHETKRYFHVFFFFFFFIRKRKEISLLPAGVGPGYWPEYLFIYFSRINWTVHRCHTTSITLDLLLELSWTMNLGPRTPNLLCLFWINWYVLKICVKSHIYVVNLIKSTNHIKTMEEHLVP